MNTIQDILCRGVSEINVRKDLEEKLKSGKKLRVKFGIDPTGSDLHLGHTVPLRKLKQFQDAGHHIILLFGTYTGKIGDPTGKDKLRKPLSDEDIKNNMKTYIHQASKILDMERVEVVQNGDWLAPLTFVEVLQLAGCFTASQMIQRDMFQKRLSEGKDINLVEFFYPLMQGYDSVPIRADVEIGGTDQLFNLMAGRKIQEHFGLPSQNIITVPILEGLDGHEKMSKSLNNYVAVLDSAKDIFGKLMSIPDGLMQKYFELLTGFSEKEITDILEQHPREAKMTLAYTISAELTTQEEAMQAKNDFIALFSERKKDSVPSDIETKGIVSKTYTILELAIFSGFFGSNSEARRKVIEGAFKIDAKKYTDPLDSFTLSLNQEYVLQFGKRKFLKVLGEE